MRSFSIILSVGKWAGVFVRRGDPHRLRISLGWVAIIVIVPEYDVLVGGALDKLYPGWRGTAR